MKKVFLTLTILFSLIVEGTWAQIQKFANSPKTAAEVAAYIRGGAGDFNISRAKLAEEYAKTFTADNAVEKFWLKTDGTPYVFIAAEVPYVLDHYTTYGMTWGDVPDLGWCGVQNGNPVPGSSSSCSGSKGLISKNGVPLSKACCGGQTPDPSVLTANLTKLNIGASSVTPGGGPGIPGPTGPQGPQGPAGQTTYLGTDYVNGNLAVYKNGEQNGVAIFKDGIYTAMAVSNQTTQNNLQTFNAGCACHGSGCGGNCGCSGGASALPQTVYHVEQRDGAAKFKDVMQGIGSVALGTGAIVGGVGILKIGQKYQPTQIFQVLNQAPIQSDGQHHCNHCQRPVTEWNWAEHDHNGDGVVNQWDIGDTPYSYDNGNTNWNWNESSGYGNNRTTSHTMVGSYNPNLSNSQNAWIQAWMNR